MANKLEYNVLSAPPNGVELILSSIQLKLALGLFDHYRILDFL